MIRDLTYAYPAAAAPSLLEVTLTFGPGLTAVVGPSGSGKSTLLRLLNGLVPHFHGGTIRGQVRIRGKDAFRTPTSALAREVGFVFQDPESQFVRSIVEDEVAFALENTAVPHAMMRERVAQAMDAAGVAHLAARATVSLSGGEKQRVAIASAIALRPGILALDEPTSQLDPGGAAAVLSACADLAQNGTTVVIAEHRAASLLTVADQLVVVDQGRVLGPGDVNRMLQHLADPPPLVGLGRTLGWDPVLVEPTEARRMAPPLRKRVAAQPVTGGAAAWELRACDLGHAGHAVLEDIEVAGHTGEVVVLMGPNGGGKTTLLRAIAGLQKPLAGRAWRSPGRVAYLPQDPGVLLHRSSVRHEVEYTLRRARSDQSAELVIGRLGLSGLAGRYPGDLSSGQRQRAALAAILAGTPTLILLDEPTRGMDLRARLALTTLVREMTASGASAVVATHDPDLAGSIADRVLVVEDSRVRDAGAPRSALSGDSPYATDIGRIYPGGPVTLEELLQCL